MTVAVGVGGEGVLVGVGELTSGVMITVADGVSTGILNCMPIVRPLAKQRLFVPSLFRLNTHISGQSRTSL